MATKDDISRARNDMLAVLDVRLATMPEWRVFRMLDKDFAGNSDASGAKQPSSPAAPGRRRGRIPGVPSYGDMAIEAFTEKGIPVNTDDVLNFIAKKRGWPAPDKKVRANVQSGLSRDKRIRNVRWNKATSWWFVDREVPRKNSARTGNPP
ncbi:MAG: hypothetical protein WAU78_17565 [Roseiarcus sp.]